jgi:ABC-type oligopeptide transport system ATPase subunit
VITEQQALDILHDLYFNYEKYFITKNQIEEEVETQLIDHFNNNKIKLIGDIPYYTLWNLQQTRKRILDIDEDGIIGVIGEAGSGKTTVSIICSFFLDKDFQQTRIIFNFEDLLYFLRDCAEEIQKELNDSTYKSPLRGEVVVLDEGVFVLFSADSLSKQGKMATKLFTVIRFLNVFMFVNMTNFNKVDRTVRETRLYSTIRVTKKGRIEYRSKQRTRAISTEDNSVQWSKPNFTENVGFIKKDSDFWQKYNKRKGQFVEESINEILEEVKK